MFCFIFTCSALVPWPKPLSYSASSLTSDFKMFAAKLVFLGTSSVRRAAQLHCKFSASGSRMYGICVPICFYFIAGTSSVRRAAQLQCKFPRHRFRDVGTLTARQFDSILLQARAQCVVPRSCNASSPASGSRMCAAT